jgi:hypothetical protein
MLQLNDGGCTANATTLSRSRPLDDTDPFYLMNTSKRQCLHHNNSTKSDDGHRQGTMSGSMDIPMADHCTNTSTGSTSITTLSPDEILIQMVQSGCYSQEEVVNFCISSGVPLSRMLRLDLMRLGNNIGR